MKFGRGSSSVRQIFTVFFSAQILCGCFGNNNTTGFNPVSRAAKNIVIEKIQSKNSDQWAKDTAGVVWVNSHDIFIAGTCANIGTLKSRVNGELAEATLPCTGGNFSTQFSVPSDDRVDLELEEVLPSGASSELTPAKAGITLMTDTVPPNSPVITTSSGNSFVTENPTFELNGTFGNDVVNVEINDTTGSITFSIPLQTFTATATLGWTQTKTYQITALDFAGNRSVPASITGSFFSETNLAIVAYSGTTSTEAITSTTSTNLLIQTSIGPFFTVPRYVNSVSGNRIHTGNLDTASGM